MPGQSAERVPDEMRLHVTSGSEETWLLVPILLTDSCEILRKLKCSEFVFE